MKKIISLIVSLAAIPNLCAFSVNADDSKKKSDDIIILYTNDVHCGIDDNIGYDGLALYKKEMQTIYNNVILADAGDALQGGNAGSLSKGAYITELMNAAEYDVAGLGNHEFDYGVSNLLERSKELDCGYISCNFVDIRTGEALYEPYKIIDCGEKQIAFVGVVTPETFSSSTPTYFQNESGEFIYSFSEKEGELIETVQKSADMARADGADYVIVIGHLGENDVYEKWSAPTIAANTTGIDAFIDGHSHEVTPSLTVKNKDGQEVVISQTGTKLANIGKMTISEDGIKTELTDIVPDPAEFGLDEEIWTERNGKFTDKAVNGKINEINGKMEEKLSEKIGHSDFDLCDSDPETGQRIVRKGETNLADLYADALRNSYSTDIGILNGGGIRKSIKQGDITYGDALSVFPFANVIFTAKVTGQQILDTLEYGLSLYPDENGAFVSSVSGMEYSIDPNIESSVQVDDFGRFVKVSGEYRVKDVKIGGQPLDPEKIYTICSNDYILEDGGDGFIMSGNCEIYDRKGELDIDVFIRYIRDELGGVIPEEYAEPLGQGRIKILNNETVTTTVTTVSEGTATTTTTEKNKNSSSSTAKSSTSSAKSSYSGENSPKTGVNAPSLTIVFSIMALTVVSAKRKNK